MTTPFHGHANPGRHIGGIRRSWCPCGDWCWPDLPCACCRAALADANPCPTCDGTSVTPNKETT